MLVKWEKDIILSHVKKCIVKKFG